MDLEAQRRVLAVPDPVEVVVAEPLLLVEEGGDRQAGRLLAVGPGAVVAVGAAPRSRRRSSRRSGRRPGPGPPRAARGCRSCRSRSRRRRPAGCRRGWRRPGTPCPPAPRRTPGGPARRGRAAPVPPARATSCGSGRCPDPVAARARRRASPSGRRYCCGRCHDPRMDQRYGMTIPFDGVPLHAQREWVEELVDLGLHGRVVVGGQRRRRLHAARAGVGVGAVAAARHAPSCPPSPAARRAWRSRWRRWPTRRPAASPSASARRRT